jgi:putative spermidine/putrescine transport system ATP-binding protein
MSDRLAVFNNGLIEQTGSPAEVYEAPQTAFVAGFVGTSNLVSGAAAQAVTGSPATFTVRPEKIRMEAPGAAVGDAECSLAGTVLDVVYLGVNTRYTVALDLGGELVVVQQNQSTSSMDALAARERPVLLVWDRVHNRLVEDSQTNHEEVSV